MGIDAALLFVYPCHARRVRPAAHPRPRPRLRLAPARHRYLFLLRAKGILRGISAQRLGLSSLSSALVVDAMAEILKKRLFANFPGRAFKYKNNVLWLQVDLYRSVRIRRRASYLQTCDLDKTLSTGESCDGFTSVI